MSDKRRKFTVYLHPDDSNADMQAMDVIESISQRIRGDFLRQSVIAGAALYQIDPRLPVLLASLYDGKMTNDQLVTLISQTTGWKPSQVDIQDVFALLETPTAEPGLVGEDSVTGATHHNMKK